MPFMKKNTSFLKKEQNLMIKHIFVASIAFVIGVAIGSKIACSVHEPTKQTNGYEGLVRIDSLDPNTRLIGIHVSEHNYFEGEFFDSTLTSMRIGSQYGDHFVKVRSYVRLDSGLVLPRIARDGGKEIFLNCSEESRKPLPNTKAVPTLKSPPSPPHR